MSVDPEIVEKKSKTNLARFGGHPMHNDQKKEQLKAVFLEKYGVDNPSRSTEIKGRMKTTFLEKYGVDNPSKNADIVEKIKTKAIERFAADKESILSKRRETNIKKYGATSNKNSHIDAESLKRMKDLDWLTHQHFDLKKPISQIANELGISATPLRLFLDANNVSAVRHSTSQAEQELKSFIAENYSGTIYENDRTVLLGKELDIYIPELKLAFELNGVFWHSESKGKNKFYHLEKTQQCQEKNIKLVHIYDTEWNDPRTREIIKSKILHLLKKSTTIYARKCLVQPVTAATARKFLQDNHIQGHCPSSTRLGLYHNNTLVGLATFGKSRFNKQVTTELLRYCCIKNHTIVGGLSKLLTDLSRTHCVDSVISYADRRWSSELSNIYQKANFRFLHNSAPNYKYFKINSTIKLLSRAQFQKHKLKGKLDFFESSLSEYENMLLNGYHRIWDCGNMVYKWKSHATT
jgi:hypothetical protein